MQNCEGKKKCEEFIYLDSESSLVAMYIILVVCQATSNSKYSKRSIL